MTSTASAIAASVSELMNTAAVFSAPRVYVRSPDVAALRQSLIDVIDRYMTAIGVVSHANPGAQPLVQVAVAAAELRQSALQWDPGQGLSPNVIEKARGCLSAFGVPEPAEGWDNFEGWKEP